MVIVVISHWHANLFSENWYAERVQYGFEGKNRSPSEGEGTWCSLHGNTWEALLKWRVIQIHWLVKRALHECIEKVFVRKNNCPTNHSTLDACRTHSVDASVLPQCTSFCQGWGRGPLWRFRRQGCFCVQLGKTETFEAMSPVKYCADLLIRYSSHVRKTRETIHQRWIPVNNLERCVQFTVI